MCQALRWALQTVRHLPLVTVSGYRCYDVHGEDDHQDCHMWRVITPPCLLGIRMKKLFLESGPLPFPHTAAHPALFRGPGAQRHWRIWNHLWDVSTWVGHIIHLLSFRFPEGRGLACKGVASWKETKQPGRVNLSTLGPSVTAVFFPHPWQSTHMFVLSK